MRALVITNLYPPTYVGGYELGCRDVVEGLIDRGGQIEVLTSDYRGPEEDDPPYVRRELPTDQGASPSSRPARLLELIQKEQKSRRLLSERVREFRPDLAYVWNLTYLSLSMLAELKRTRVPVAFYVFDEWVKRWRDDPWIKGLAKAGPAASMAGRAFGLAPLDQMEGDLAQYASRYLLRATREGGVSFREEEVIPFGVSTKLFAFRERRGPPKRLLYAGQLVPHKGVHTLLEGFALPAGQKEFAGMSLTVAGGSPVPGYAEGLRRRADELGISDRVAFKGPVPRESLPGVYEEHDVLVFPSEWEEPFGITILEAMSSGLAVIATGSGGSAEVLEPGKNALTFPAGDARALAGEIKRLIASPGLLQRLSAAGRETVFKRYRLESAIEAIEGSLLRAMRK